MKRKALIGGFLVGYVVVSVSAHDTFLKFDTYFLPPNSQATVSLLTGTFQKSENPINRERMQDVSLVTPAGGRLHPPLSQWRDEGEISLLDLQMVEAGTYVVGVSLKPREIDLKAAEFNDYLEHDGIPDILAQRRRDGQLDWDVCERYSKHVKAIFQVGDGRTDSFKTPLGYAVEIIPQQNPYALKVGQTIALLCLKDGKPVANQLVMAGWETGDGVSPPLEARTDTDGIVRFELKAAGKWYVKFIHMEPLKDPKVNYESKWATLTFEIK